MSNGGSFEIEILFRGTGSEATDDSFDNFIDCVLDELDQLGRQVDATGSLRTRKVVFSMAVSELSDDGLIEALSALRTALHAAHCGTQDCPAGHEVLGARGVSSGELQDA